MKLIPFTVFFFMSFIFSLQGQTSGFPMIAVGGCYDYGLLHIPQQGLKNNCIGYGLGFFSEKKTSAFNNHLSLQLGIIYTYRYIHNYENEPYYPTLERVIHLNTNINQHVIKTQLMMKYRFEQNRFSFGAGTNISFILLSKTNQTSNEPYDSLTYQRIRYNYDRKNDRGIHAYNRFNIAPVFNVGFKITDRLDLDYFISYDLMAPEQKFINYTVYHLLNNSIFLTFKIN